MGVKAERSGKIREVATSSYHYEILRSNGVFWFYKFSDSLPIATANPGTLYVSQTGFELTHLPAFASGLLK